jgi:hypothetical protein
MLATMNRLTIADPLWEDLHLLLREARQASGKTS